MATSMPRQLATVTSPTVLKVATITSPTVLKCWNRILKAFANSLDPDETPQNVASHQDPN
ncbi:hypothetical protein DPMN_106935, partial [Dreissena polymorpha]